MLKGSEAIKRFQMITGIRDPNVDAWFINQDTYRKYGIQHPIQRAEKPEPEPRSRSPLIPGPRKTKSEQDLDKELYERWMDENFIHRNNTTYFFPDFDLWFLTDDPWDHITTWSQGGWNLSRLYGYDPADKFQGIGTISGISKFEGTTANPNPPIIKDEPAFNFPPWSFNKEKEKMDADVFRMEVLGDFTTRKGKHDDKNSGGAKS
jgi:hypothetical protein